MNEFAVERPTRLVDTHARLIDEDDLLVDGALKSQGRHVQLRVGPRHVRVVPRDPCQLRAIRGHRWSLREVGPAEDGNDGVVIAGRRTVQRNCHDGVDGFAFARVILGHRVDEAAHVGNPEVAVTNLRQGRQRSYAAARLRRIKGVHASVGAIRENDDAVVHRVRLAAILMDAGANVWQTHTVDQRQDLSRLTGAPTAQERATTALKRMTLHPVGIWPVHANLG